MGEDCKGVRRAGGLGVLNSYTENPPDLDCFVDRRCFPPLEMGEQCRGVCVARAMESLVVWFVHKPATDFAPFRKGSSKAQLIA